MRLIERDDNKALRICARLRNHYWVLMLEYDFWVAADFILEKVPVPARELLFRAPLAALQAG